MLKRLYSKLANTLVNLSSNSTRSLISQRLANGKSTIVSFLATKLPDVCPFARLGLDLCKLNPLYEDVVAEKTKRLGYRDLYESR